MNRLDSPIRFLLEKTYQMILLKILQNMYFNPKKGLLDRPQSVDPTTYLLVLELEAG